MELNWDNLTKFANQMTNWNPIDPNAWYRNVQVNPNAFSVQTAPAQQITPQPSVGAINTPYSPTPSNLRTVTTPGGATRQYEATYNPNNSIASYGGMNVIQPTQVSAANPSNPSYDPWVALTEANNRSYVSMTTPASMGGTSISGGEISPWQQAQMDWEKQKWQQQQSAAATELAAQQAYQQQQLQYQQQQLAWQQQQAAAQLAAEKEQRLATLSAQPKSWLEYASLANQPPVVQPWMLPLMPQDYQNTQPVGAAISGWTPGNMKGMPDLITPSAQYMARMGPTAQQQYYGYQQADQGMTSDETDFRFWNLAPTGGKNKGLYQAR
jgi:hypothetical protein